MDHLILAFPQLSPYLDQAFPGGVTPREEVVERLLGVSRGTVPVTVVFPVGEESGRECSDQAKAVFPASWHILPLEDTTAAGALGAIARALPPETEHLTWVDGNAPFFSPALTGYLQTLHSRSWCDYTFGDGFPQGYAPQIIRRDTLPVLAALAEGRDLVWSSSVLFDTISLDINAFDIETEAACDDYALLRLSLTVDSRANYLLCCALAKRGLGKPWDPSRSFDPFRERFPDGEDPLLQCLKEDRLLGRTLPRYIQIQLTTRRDQQPLFLPPVPGAPPAGDPSGEKSKENHRDMTPEAFGAILEDLSRFSPEAVISLGYYGEPGLSPHLPQLLDSLALVPRATVYLETSGVGWSQENRAALLASHDQLQAVIVEVDAAREETYQALRGQGWEEARAFIEEIRHVLAGRIHIQATRMIENEWELQEFFQYWQDQTGLRPLIQKYNSCAGVLPERRVADLSPLKRTPCRHLERDLVILADGRVIGCLQDLQAKSLRGICPGDSLETVWEHGREDYRRHLSQDYPQLCRNCDEYYTINA
ncbi:spiro-SPASM protein [Alkalispirochaeta americana]|uniref:Spiro-SPASM protein n=1 Tax=Alkalispirochaeta americana TaxID=159291 RepID=A0A1N6PBF2_9SPIO|nr:spiro-SPASM protein [Alkalispirochaeta americana]SIQ01556.1 spiro-SPASM protein [Alkalispirochaeta americana]